MQFIKNDHLISNSIISLGDFQIESISASHTYVTPPHSYIRYSTEHKNDRMIYIASGNLIFNMYNNKPLSASAGDTVYIPYNIAYKADWSENIRGELFSINYIMKDNSGYQTTLNSEIHIFSECSNKILKGLFVECFNTFNRAEYAYLLKCKYIFLELLHTMCIMEGNIDKSKVSKAIKYIELNYLEEINISELAKMCNLGECMFRRCFKQTTGVSPLKYKNNLKIQYAYELLSKEGCSVAEAMEMTGFYDASYFNKCFKLYIGKSPSECRLKKPF